jgi:hypothetical protein
VEIKADREVKEEDSKIVRDMLNDLGKWETLVKGSLHLLLDLGIRQFSSATLESYEKPLGTEIYDDIKIEKSGDFSLDCSIHIKKEERNRRELLKISPVFPINEITDQLGNVPKWRAFKKTMLIIKEQLR